MDHRVTGRTMGSGRTRPSERRRIYHLLARELQHSIHGIAFTRDRHNFSLGGGILGLPDKGL